MKKIVVILDALKANKINLLKSLLKETICSAEVIPPFSFEPDAAYLCGKYPEDSDAGLKYWKADKPEVSKLFSYLNLLPNNPRLLRKAFNKLINKINFKPLRKYQNNLSLIPFNMLMYFELSQKNELFKKKSGFKYDTIFDLLKNDYYYIGVPHTSGRLDNVRMLIDKKELLKYDTIFIYLSDLDSTGHKYGGNAIEYNEKLRELISFINELTGFLKENKEKVEYLIFGDHGMVDVKEYVNIQKILKKLPLEVEKDYIYFLDSTLARFWFFNEKARDIIITELEKVNKGSWMTNTDFKNYRMNYNHNKYGDAIWWVKEGVVISPNFWQGKKRLKGMHGYRKDVKDNHTLLLSNNRNLKLGTSPINMVEINRILKSFLGIG